MAWLDGWAYRVPVAVDNTTPAATQDVNIYLPVDFDHFWDTIDASGDELRVTEADGITAVSAYQLSGFNKTNKTGTVQVDALTAHASDTSVVLCWLYYGNSGAASAAGSFTPASPVDGFIHLGRPKYIVGGESVQAGASRPRRRLQKTVGERIYVWFEVRGLLEKRQRPYGGSFMWEEVQRVVTVITNGGTDPGTMTEAAETRFVEVSRARGRLNPGFYVGLLYKAGTTATNYTLEPVIKTYAPEVDVDGGALVQGPYRILEPRALLRVEDIDED